MTKISSKVHFIKSADHLPLCGRGKIVAFVSTRWREVTCRRCRRVIEHQSKLAKRRAQPDMEER